MTVKITKGTGDKQIITQARRETEERVAREAAERSKQYSQIAEMFPAGMRRDFTPAHTEALNKIKAAFGGAKQAFDFLTFAQEFDNWRELAVKLEDGLCLKAPPKVPDLLVIAEGVDIAFGWYRKKLNPPPARSSAREQAPPLYVSERIRNLRAAGQQQARVMQTVPTEFRDD